MPLRQQIFLFLLGCLVVVSRQPESITNPQFWAEDGALWYAQAYERGALATLFQHWGYFFLVPRWTAAAAVQLPLAYGPLVFHLVAVAINVLPLNYLASGRFAPLIPDLRARLLLGFGYLALPHTATLHANIATIGWRLALLAMLVFLAAPARGWLEQAADTVIVAVSGLTGPFAFVLAPAAGLCWVLRREGRPTAPMLALAASLALQGGLVLMPGDNPRGYSRTPAPLGASAPLFVEIVGRQIGVAGLIGERGAYVQNALYPARWITIAGFSAVMAVFGYVLWRAPWRIRVFLLFASTALALSLSKPLASMGSPQWPLLVQTFTGHRYWMLPTIAFLLSLGWMAQHARERAARLPAALLLALAPVGFALDYSMPVPPDRAFIQRAGQFLAVSPGTTMVFAIQPDGWHMALTKK